MSFNIEGEQCPVCHAYLFEDDDVVFCPECGAPHHRDCYSHLGHCGMAEYHGTDMQYDRAKAAKQKTESEPIKEEAPKTNGENKVTCRMCKEEYDSSSMMCPRCGQINFSAMHGAMQFDFLGGVPADMDIGEGVTADEAKRFVATNTTRYIPKFAAMNAGKRFSWNWLAFLFPCGWFLSRKMHLIGIFVGIITVALSLLQLPFVKAFYNLGMADSMGYMQDSQTMMQAMESLSQIGTGVLIGALIGIVLDIVLRVVCAVMGDYLYRKHTISSIKQMRSESEDMDEDYRRRGGVSIFAMMLGLLAVQHLPSIIFNFLI